MRERNLSEFLSTLHRRGSGEAIERTGVAAAPPGAKGGPWVQPGETARCLLPSVGCRHLQGSVRRWSPPPQQARRSPPRGSPCRGPGRSLRARRAGPRARFTIASTVFGVQHAGVVALGVRKPRAGAHFRFHSKRILEVALRLAPAFCGHRRGLARSAAPAPSSARRGRALPRGHRRAATAPRASRRGRRSPPSSGQPITARHGRGHALSSSAKRGLTHARLPYDQEQARAAGESII